MMTRFDVALFLKSTYRTVVVSFWLSFILWLMSMKTLHVYVFTLQTVFHVQYGSLFRFHGTVSFDMRDALFLLSQTTPEFWKTWHDFEVHHGNEDTFREMLRIKRSVQAQFNTQVKRDKPRGANEFARPLPYIRRYMNLYFAEQYTYRARQNPCPLARGKWVPVRGKQVSLATWRPGK